MDLSNREVALIIWFFIFAVWAIRIEGVRGQLWNMVKILTSGIIVKVLAVMFVYILCQLLVLRGLGLWDMSQMKNTIVWSFSVGLLTTFRVNDLAKEEGYFINAVKDNFKIIAAIEFVVNFHALSLVVELILIPISTFLIMVQAYTEIKNEEGYEVVHKVVTRALGVIVTAVLVYEVVHIANNTDEFFSSGTFNDFLVPVLLSVMFLPFLYCMMLYTVYENIFIRIPFFANDDEMIKYTKRITVKTFMMNLRPLQRWADHLHKLDYRSKGSIKRDAEAIKAGEIGG